MADKHEQYTIGFEDRLAVAFGPVLALAAWTGPGDPMLASGGTGGTIPALERHHRRPGRRSYDRPHWACLGAGRLDRCGRARAGLRWTGQDDPHQRRTAGQFQSATATHLLLEVECASLGAIDKIWLLQATQAWKRSR
jgi:hypothetical protein